MLAGEPEPFRRLGFAPAQPEVLRDDPGRSSSTRAQADRLPRPPVQQPPPAKARALVGDLAGLLVPEIVGVAVDLADDTPGGQLLERRHGLLVAATAHVAREVGVERTAEDSGCDQHLGGDLADRRQSGLEQVANAGRQRPVRRRVVERVEVLDDEVRQTAGLVEQPR